MTLLVWFAAWAIAYCALGWAAERNFMVLPGLFVLLMLAG